MWIKQLTLEPYTLHFSLGFTRSGLILRLTDAEGSCGYGDIAPLPTRSCESLLDAERQIRHYEKRICSLDWNRETCLQQLAEWNLFPSVSFGLESALLSFLWPVSIDTISTSAFLMGSVPEMLSQAKEREQEGYTLAKIKVGHLSCAQASEIITQLKDRFRLRIDVNRAWKTQEALSFFGQFPLDAFDYIEEPFQNPHDLPLFPHPLAIDESFPEDLSFSHLEALPTLKALIYKPMVQGGMAFYGSTVQPWLQTRQISCVLGSSFESPIGLKAIASMAKRLSLTTPLGIGTNAYISNVTDSK